MNYRLARFAPLAVAATAAVFSLGSTPTNADVWQGDVSTSWNTLGNWDNEVPPGNNANGPGTKQDRAIFGTRAPGAFDPTHNPSNFNEVAGLLFQDEWTLTLTTDIRLRQNGRGIDVNIPGKDGIVTINGTSGDDVLFFDNPDNSIAAGDTLILNRGWQALTNGQDHEFLGGGTFIFNGAFATGNNERDTEFDVTGNTTLVANTLMRLGDANANEALDINAGSTLAGTGGLSAGGAGDNRFATIDGTLSPGWDTTTFADFTFAGTSRLDINGILEIDIDELGSSDSVITNTLNLGANSILDITGLSGADEYILATYTSLTGTFDQLGSTIPVGYELDYNFEGGNQIALVSTSSAAIPEPASLALVAIGASLLMARRKQR